MRNRQPPAVRVGNKGYTKKISKHGRIRCQAYCYNERRFYGKPDKQFGTYEMDVQVPHSVHSEIQKEGHIQSVSIRLARNNPNSVQVQRSRDA